MITNFFSQNFYDDINKNVMAKIFPNLISAHRDILYTYLTQIINLIAIRFNFDETNKNEYAFQFTCNNYRDTIGLLYILLPYIDDNMDTKKHKLTDLNELYISKLNNDDINLVEPKYEYCNIQYGRCNRYKKRAKEIQFNKEHIQNNFELLKESINAIANKLYVNWINIRPFDPNYEETSLYQNTHNAIIKYDLKNKPYPGLLAQDVYNALTNYVYKNIIEAKIKWMIYDIYVLKNAYKSTHILNKLINIEQCVKGTTWITLTQSLKDRFSEEWFELIEAIIISDSLNTVSYLNIITLMKHIMSFGNDVFKKDKNYVDVFSGKVVNVEDIDIDDEIINQVTDDKVKESMKSIQHNPGIMYEYFVACFKKLSKTWFGHYYMTYDNQYNLHESELSYIDENKLVTIKCVYNYAKGLCHYTDADVYKEYPSQWKSLSKDDTKKIMDNINSKFGEWFSVKGILRRSGVKDVDTVNVKIYKFMRDNLASLIFDIYIKHGILTEFVVDRRLTDYESLPKMTKDRNIEIHNLVNEYVIDKYRATWKNSTYFLNQLPYDDLFLDGIQQTKKGSWITTYAMDWVSQINTFHKYLNNRIIYVTGGTGQGKSTQVPKLLLYALKMIDYKIDGLIACTQPRISPITKNSTTIAIQMGVPIWEFNESLNKDVSTNNRSIQYQYKKLSSARDEYGLKLRIMTDGTLDTELDNPLCKRRYEKTLFDTKNEYDIIIVDEAHEHNAYMDMILTKMRNIVYYNNDIKLVIISATMDEDEPKYRRYYRMINDNKMYPLSKYIEEHHLDRINVDRRINLSPPGLITQYHIEHIYKKDANENDIVLEIINTTKVGDVLLFQPGEANIRKSVEYINSKTSEHKNVIALPFYSKMDERVKGSRELIENIESRKGDLTMSKQNAFDYKFGEVPANTYDRVIIVATGIAEASITIDSLVYVVDNGEEKVNNFDYSTRSEKLEVRMISESSRVQRSGRVGRTQPGVVYSTYEKGAMLNNRKPYDIAISDISDKLFTLLHDSNSEMKNPYFNLSNDPNYEIGSYEFEIGKIIDKQYMLKGEFYKYYGNQKHYDYDYDKKYRIIPKQYDDGYEYVTLNDRFGSFYIIHPDELCLKRNILGNIVGVNEGCGSLSNEMYKSTKMSVFWDMLKETLFIVKKQFVSKTKFGSLISALKNDLLYFVNLGEILSYVYGRKYSCDNDIIKLLTMYKLLPLYGPSGLSEQFGVYKNQYGDGYALLQICDGIINLYDKIARVLGLMKEEYDEETWAEQKQKFFNHIGDKDYSDIDKEYIDDLLTLYQAGKLSPSNKLEPLERKQLKVSKFTVNNIRKIHESKYMDSIMEYSKNKYLNYDIVAKFYKNYVSTLDELREHFKTLFDIGKVTPLLITNYKKYDKYACVQFCMIQSYPNNLLQNVAIMDGTYYYVNVLYPSIKNVNQISKFKNVNNTFLSNIHQTLLYISKDIDVETTEQSVYFIENVQQDLISRLIPLSVRGKKSVKIDKYREEMDTLLKSLAVNVDKTVVYNNIINNYMGTLEDVRRILNNGGDVEVMKLLSVIDDRMNVKSLIGLVEDVDIGEMSGGANYEYVGGIIKMLWSI